MLKVYFISLFVVLVACDVPPQAPQEIEAIVASTPPTKTVATTTEITPQQVREIFEQDVLKRLLAQETGRELHVDNPYLEKGLRVLVADINGDGQPEGIVQYQLLAGDAESAGSPVVDGIYIYPSEDGKLQPIEMTRVELPAFPAYLQQIEGRVWSFKVFEYAQNDSSCCPSIVTEKQYQLTKLYAWEKVD